MNDITQLLQQIGAKQSPFSLSSRYRNVPVSTMEKENGDTIAFLNRRFVPPAESFFLLKEHTVSEGERVDHIANEYLGDPERFWQICDANNVIDPDELIENAGNKIRITLPEGIPGNQNA